MCYATNKTEVKRTRIRTPIPREPNCIIPVFGKQDVELLLAYHRVKRFQIKNEKDLRDGTVVNVRETIALKNCLIAVIRLHGYRTKASYNLGLIYRDSFTLKQSSAPVNAANVVEWYRAPVGKTPFASKKERRGLLFGDIHCDTLLKQNISFKYNTKVMQFLELLAKADRFQQHCILNNKKYTLDNYHKWTEIVLLERNAPNYYL